MDEEFDIKVSRKYLHFGTHCAHLEAEEMNGKQNRRDLFARYVSVTFILIIVLRLRLMSAKSHSTAWDTVSWIRMNESRSPAISRLLRHTSMPLIYKYQKKICTVILAFRWGQLNTNTIKRNANKLIRTKMCVNRKTLGQVLCLPNEFLPTRHPSLAFVFI